jgi:hypothetical protein
MSKQRAPTTRLGARAQGQRAGTHLRVLSFDLEVVAQWSDGAAQQLHENPRDLVDAKTMTT